MVYTKEMEEDFSEIRFKYHNKEKDCYEEVYLYPDKLPYGICKHLIATIKNKTEKLLIILIDQFCLKTLSG